MQGAAAERRQLLVQRVADQRVAEVELGGAERDHQLLVEQDAHGPVDLLARRLRRSRPADRTRRSRRSRPPPARSRAPHHPVAPCGCGPRPPPCRGTTWASAAASSSSMCSGMPLLRSCTRSTSSADGRSPDRDSMSRSVPCRSRRARRYLLAEPLAQQAGPEGGQRRAGPDLVAAVGRDHEARRAADHRGGVASSTSRLSSSAQCRSSMRSSTGWPAISAMSWSARSPTSRRRRRASSPAGVVADEPFLQGRRRHPVARAAAAPGRGRRARRRGTRHPAARRAWSGSVRRRAARGSRRAVATCRSRPRR